MKTLLILSFVVLLEVNYGILLWSTTVRSRNLYASATKPFKRFYSFFGFLSVQFLSKTLTPHILFLTAKSGDIAPGAILQVSSLFGDRYNMIGVLSDSAVLVSHVQSMEGATGGGMNSGPLKMRQVKTIDKRISLALCFYDKVVYPRGAGRRLKEKERRLFSHFLSPFSPFLLTKYTHIHRAVWPLSLCLTDRSHLLHTVHNYTHVAFFLWTENPSYGHGDPSRHDLNLFQIACARQNRIGLGKNGENGRQQPSEECISFRQAFRQCIRNGAPEEVLTVRDQCLR